MLTIMVSMKKTLVSLFVALSLLTGPMAHAAEVKCEGDICQTSEQVKKKADGTQQDNDKMAKGGHHCCSHVSALPDSTINKSAPDAANRTSFILEHDAIASVVIGPPLKPPSHA